MENKYRINTNWSQNGKDKLSGKEDKPSIYYVIMNLIDELDKSLKTQMMEKSKSDEEVRKILDNPVGITIEELQVIDTWGNTRELRVEVRDRLDSAYRHLSAELAHLIATRNDMGNKGIEKSNDIDAKNGELKNTMVSQHKMIETLVKDYEEKAELSEKERKKLVYIRKVYLTALREIIERLFLTASKDTKRVEMFPRDEQKKVLNEISGLRDRIRDLTRESKQKQKGQQKENDKKLELERKELEKESNSLKKLKDELNSSFPNLIDSENKVNERIWKNIEGDLVKLKEIQKQIDEESQIIKKVKEKLNNLIEKGIDDRTKGGLDRAEIRSLVGEVRNGLEEIIVELQKEVSLKNSSERETDAEYQNQQVQMLKK